MDLATLFSTAFIVGFSGAMMPGPMLTMVINETSRRGFLAGPLVVAGHAAVELLLVAGLVLGLSRFLHQPAVTAAIGIAGGAMLLWMGWGIAVGVLRGRISLSLEKTDGGGAYASVLVPIRAGIVTSISNPYWSLWWATVGAGYTAIAVSLGVLGILVFFTGHILSDLIWFSLVSGVVHTGRNFISDRIYKGLLLTCGIFLLYLGARFAYEGIGMLR